MSHDEDAFYSPTHRVAGPRQRRVGELLFEFYVERTKKFYRCELFDRGDWGVEAQFLDPIDQTIARTFNPRLDPTRTPREMEREIDDRSERAAGSPASSRPQTRSRSRQRPPHRSGSTRLNAHS